MQFKSSRHTRSRSVAIAGLILIWSLVASANGGQGMQNMPGMGKSKPAAQKKRTSKRKPTKKHQMANMPGMKMPGMKMPAAQTSPRPKPSPEQMNMPGMNMRQTSPSPSASPQKMEMNMPMPSASPGASPQKMDMNMPMPMASPSPGQMGGMKGMENMPGMGSMNMGPLMVMSGDEMGIRVGSSDTNVMWMGQMGSGTSWLPASTPMYMYHKQSGDWLLMFHYNAVV